MYVIKVAVTRTCGYVHMYACMCVYVNAQALTGMIVHAVHC